MNAPIEKIQALSEKYRDYTADLLSQMIRIPGFSRREEARCKRIVELCQQAGFDEVRIDGLGSVIGRVGHGPKKLAFDAHIDTVEIGDRAQWLKDPHCGEIADGQRLATGPSGSRTPTAVRSRTGWYMGWAPPTSWAALPL